MHSTRRGFTKFSLPGSPSFTPWQMDRLVAGEPAKRRSAVWSTLKFIGLLPVALAMFLLGLLAQLAFVVISVLMIPILILAPVLGISLLILLAGLGFKFLGVGP